MSHRVTTFEPPPVQAPPLPLSCLQLSVQTVPFARLLQPVQAQSIPIAEPLASSISATSMPAAPVVVRSLPVGQPLKVESSSPGLVTPPPAILSQPPVRSKLHSAAKPKESTTPIPYDPRGGLLRPVPIPPGTLLTGEYEQDNQGQNNVEAAVKGSSPWLVSLIVHIALLVILGLWMLATSKPEIDILLEFTDGTDQLIESEVDLDLASVEEEVELIEESVAPLEELPEVPDPAPPEGPPLELFDGSFSAETETPGEAGLEGRTPGMKKILLSLYGGTPGTEAAVLEGLRWLKRTQNKDGSWQMNPTSRSSRIRVWGGGISRFNRRENRAAATAMALLAYQGANHLGKKGEFKTTVLQGWRALLKMQERNGKFPARHASKIAEMYTQAFCTIALCEMYGMTRDSDYLIPARDAVDYCVKMQRDDGGWKYNRPGDPHSDLSVTGWMVMAMQSAKMAGIKVPEKTFKKIDMFLDSVSRYGGARYVYEPRESSHTSPALSAVGLLCRQYRGWKQDDPRLVQGVNYLLDNYPLSYSRNNKDVFGNSVKSYPPDVYYWYYISQVAHHMGSKQWTRWNNVMREEVPKHQVKETGPDKGSWNPEGDRYSKAGRHYVTCMSIYMLEVYYRHMPLYTLKP